MDSKGLALFFIFLLAGGLSCSRKSDDLNRVTDFTSQRYIVKFKQKWGSENQVRIIEDSVAPHGETEKIEELAPQTFSVVFRKNVSARQALQGLLDPAEVEYVENDYEVHAFHTPNDPEHGKQWAHAVVQSYQAWNLGQGSEDIVVAIIDTGVDVKHPDLVPNIWKNPHETAGNGVDDDGNGLVDDINGWNFVANNNQPNADDSNFHGTHVAGTVGAVGDNGQGGIGHSPRVKLMALKFLSSSGSGSISDAIKCIDYARLKGAKILSNSWGGGQYSQALSEAIQRARQAGILFVAAAGNGGADGVGDNNDSVPTYPANYSSDNIISVAATDPSDQLTSFSNYGPKSVHVGAPGINIYSTKNGNAYQNLSGTSMATPLVSGVVAMMWALKPDHTYHQIKQALLGSVDQVSGLKGKLVSHGRVNAFRALQKVQGLEPDPNPTPSPTPSPPPGSGRTATPTIQGSESYQLSNPYLSVSIDYDVSQFSGAWGVYFEVSRPNTPFSNPNGDQPDPLHLTYAYSNGLRNRIQIVPAQNLPGWGVYSMRVIPLNSQGNPLGHFSDPLTLILSPQ